VTTTTQVDTLAQPAVVGAAETAAPPHPRTGYWLTVASHAVVDVFPMVVISLMIVLQDRLALTQWQETAVWVATPIFSGIIQPLAAWLGDRYDTRLAGPLGLACGAVCLGSIGFAQSFWQLIALQIVGVIGVGMYHPAAAAVAGQTGSRALRHGRAFALSIFVFSGMVGHTLGPIIATRINHWFGMTHIAWLIGPSILMAIVMYAVTRKASHRPDNHHELHAALSASESRDRWLTAILLSAQNAIRFTVNTGMYILFSYWAAWRISHDPDAAAIVNGNLTAATTIGMGAGALLGGRFTRRGNEKIVFVVTALGGAVCVSVINVAGLWASAAMYGAAMLAAVGFFFTVPPSVGLAQRLLPGHASLATSMLLGVAWVIGALSRPITSGLLGGAQLDKADALTAGDFNRAFIGFAVLLALAGVVALLMPARTLRAAASSE
jgi:MFS family permease